VLSEQHISRLWIKMVRIYGHRWRSSFGNADDGTWLTGLKHLSPEQLTQGIVHCTTSGEAWPPTLPEFRAMCLQLPTVEALVQGALAESPDPKAQRLRATVDSFTRNSLQRTALAQIYRTNARAILNQMQAELTGVPITDETNRSGFNRVLKQIRS